MDRGVGGVKKKKKHATINVKHEEHVFNQCEFFDERLDDNTTRSRLPADAAFSHWGVLKSAGERCQSTRHLQALAFMQSESAATAHFVFGAVSMTQWGVSGVS